MSGRECRRSHTPPPRYTVRARRGHVLPSLFPLAKHARAIYYLPQQCQPGNYGSAIMDAMWFQQALDRAGASQADLARQLRLAPSAISRMLKGERQMKLTEAVQVAAFLGVSQEEVLRHAGDNTPPPPRTEPPRRGRPPRAGLAPSGPPRAEPIPIRAAVRGGGDQEMFLEDGPIGYTARPTNLVGVRGAYAI